MRRGIIVVAGVPGAGKTTLGRLLARAWGLAFLRLSSLVLEHGAWSRYDPAGRGFVIDVEGVCGVLRGYVERLGGFVLETHWPGVVSECGLSGLVRGVVAVRCRPGVLSARLRRRGWRCGKLVENVEAEALGVVAREAYELAVGAGAWFYEAVTCVEGCGGLCYEFREGCCVEFVDEVSMLGAMSC